MNQHPKAGCYTSISAAVAAANAGDTIEVAAGTYTEGVVITKTLSLVGANQNNTIINATGENNGIYIDGLNAPGLAGVSVSGFTVEYAKFEGILVQNATDVTVARNTVQDNDQNLVVGTTSVCTGLPAFETSEGGDCGEGIHLMGAAYSTVAENTVQHNAGGIQLSDETAMNHDNVITRNTVQDNAYDCGITIVSHAAYVQTGTAPLAFGTMHNTISENESIHNGFGSSGGAGIGLFAAGPGQVTTFNSVVNNRLIGNMHPGVSIHNHANLTFPNHPPNPNVNSNSIVGNYISGNGADPAVGTTAPTGISVLGVTPVLGEVIAGNVIEDEGVDVGVNSASLVMVHMNDLSGNNNLGVENLNAAGSVDATENWWGCSGGPAARGCSTVSGAVVWTPWLTTPIQATEGAGNGDSK